MSVDKDFSAAPFLTAVIFFRKFEVQKEIVELKGLLDGIRILLSKILALLINFETDCSDWKDKRHMLDILFFPHSKLQQQSKLARLSWTQHSLCDRHWIQRLKWESFDEKSSMELQLLTFSIHTHRSRSAAATGDCVWGSRLLFSNSW